MTPECPALLTAWMVVPKSHFRSLMLKGMSFDNGLGLERILLLFLQQQPSLHGTGVITSTCTVITQSNGLISTNSLEFKIDNISSNAIVLKTSLDPDCSPKLSLQ